MLTALGPQLTDPKVWQRSDPPLQGELADIFLDTGGAHKWAHYLPIYEYVLTPYRSRPIRMLEIGVYKGGSLNMWRRYLLPDSVIVGIDIDPDCKQYEDPDRRIHVRIGPQEDVKFLRQVIDEFGPFDVILDDGSHRASHMVASFQSLFLHAVSEGGVYVVEDIHANYWWQARDQPTSFVDFTKYLIDAMHAHYYHVDDELEFRVNHPRRIPNVTVPEITTHLGGIEFYDSVAVIHHRSRALPRSIHR
jgi:hypothetical protein